MPTINPHINFNGNAQEAFDFYKSVFGGEFSRIVRFKDLPEAQVKITESELENLVYIGLPIGNNLLIGNDIPKFMGRVSENENRSKIAVAAESSEEAARLFKGLSAGGVVELPFEDDFAMFRDRFGIEWIIEFDADN